MKKRIAVFIALIIGFSYCFTGIAVMAAQNEEKEVQIADDKETEDKEEEPAVDEESVVENLHVPQKLQMVVDPWEMDGKGQIYSEQYTIKNAGETPGTLTLSNLMCETGEDSDVTVEDSPQGIHDGRDKSVYIEMVFGNKEKIVLTQEESSYTADINPGEELALSFSGEINENAEKSWKDGDIGVKVTYSWKLKPKEEFSEKEAEAEEEKVITDQELPKADVALEEKDEPEIMELKEPVQENFAADCWKADEEGRIYSPLYKVQNTGETAGIFTLSEMVCRPAEESGITVQPEKKKLYETEGRAVYMELIPKPEEQAEKPEEEKERYILFPELEEKSPEAAEYQVELKPGEEVTFRLAGELHGVEASELKKGDIVATAIYSWTAEEAAEE